eukprot:7116618-Prymnesium_polylepis.1
MWARVDGARRIAEDSYGPNPSREVILKVADFLCENADDRESDGDDAAENAANAKPKRLDADATECATCDETDAAMFSSRMLNKRGRHGDRVRRCKACVAASEQAEHAQVDSSSPAGAQPDAPAASGRPDPSQEQVECASCGETLVGTQYSRNQLQKARGGKLARCMQCVELAGAS